MDNTTAPSAVSTLNLSELKKYCKINGIKGYSRKNKKGIIQLILDQTGGTTPQTEAATETTAETVTANESSSCANVVLEDDNQPASNAPNITILNSDCMSELEKFEDNSIDCVITDPPYFIDKLDDKWSSDDMKNDKKNSHIKHLPKGMKFSKDQVKKLYDYYLSLSKLLFTKMKPGAYFLSFSSPRLYHAIAMSCEIAGFEIRDMINWTYTQSMPKGMSMTHVIKKMDLDDTEKERLIEEYKNFKTPQIRSCFEPICVAMKPVGKLTFIKNELQFKTGLLDFSQKVGANKDRVPANVMTAESYNETYDKNFMVSKPNKTEKGGNNTHITVKPLALMEHLVRLFSKENALVVDPFLGSGTTALACKHANRKCVGIELNAEYYHISRERCGL